MCASSARRTTIWPNGCGKGKFRQDLYYRLNVIPIQMPALRELREDIPEIAQRILERLRGDADVRFSEDALLALQGYDFPGNVRELENVIERALALCSEGRDSRRRICCWCPWSTTNPTTWPSAANTRCRNIWISVEKQALLEALEQTGFNRTAAAKLLGLTFRTMRYRMERLGIKDPHGTD